MADYSLGRATGEIGLKYTGAGAARSAQADLDGIERKGGKAGQSLDKVGGVAAKGGLAIAAGLGLAVRAAANFEQSLSGIKAVTGASSSDMEALRQKALQLGKDTKFSASEASQAMEELAKAGVPLPAILNGAADATVALAAAGEVSLPEAAEIAANAMNQFGLSAQQLPNVADQIAGAANASAISVGEFRQSLQQAGATAALSGLSFNDLAQAIAIMGNAGIKGSDAGTSIKTFLQNLQPQTKKQTALFKDLGLITEKGGNQFFDAKGKVKSFADISQTLQTALKGQTQEQKLATLQTLFGSDAIRAAAVFAKQGSAGFDAMAKSIGKVKAADVAKTRMDNLNGTLEQLKGSVETAAIAIGTGFLPILRAVAEGVNALFGAFLNLSPGVQSAIGTILGAIGAFLLIVAAGFKLIAMFNAAKAAVLAFNLTFAANPVGIIVVAIIALAAAVFLLYKRFAPVREVVDTIGRALKGAFLTALPYVISFGQAVADKVIPAVQAIGRFIVGTVLPALKSFGEFLNANVLPALQAVGNFIMQNVLPALKSFGAFLAANVQPALESVGNFIINNVLPALKSFGGFLRGTVLPALQAVGSFLLSTFGPIFVQVAGYVREFVTSAIKYFQEILPNVITIFNFLVGFISGAIQVIVAVVKPPLTVILAAFVLAFLAIKLIVTSVFNALGPFIVSTLQVIAGLITGLLTGIANIFRGVLNIISGIVRLFLAVLTGDWSSAGKALGQIVRGLWQVVKGIFQAAIAVVVAVVRTGINIVVAVFRVAGSVIAGVARALWSVVTAVFRAGIALAKSVVQSGINNIKTFFQSLTAIVGVVRGIFANVYNAVRSAIGNVYNSIRSGLSNAVSYVRGLAGQFLEAGKQMILAIARGIESVASVPLNAAKKVVGKIASILPGSPVKEGPLKVLNNGYAGGQIVKMVADGITASIGTLEVAAGRMAVPVPNILDSVGPALAASAARTTSIGPTGTPRAAALDTTGLQPVLAGAVRDGLSAAKIDVGSDGIARFVIGAITPNMVKGTRR